MAHMKHEGNKHMEGHKKARHESGPYQHGESEREGRAWGHGEFANMPQEQQMKVYPRDAHHGSAPEDDTMTDIDRVNHFAARQTNRYLSNQK
jgi:hypothetical protein